uniref:AlNc14C187G8362 protein n=1 Tax=Albugo laibachii Nc14 TaxID=890382 RepID=F0WPL7_9STRA|nr:AlNc14C187G8362 [Albugo laibachii Nc14]|eukprot:CCA23267.1 AlNc14C187G8362 [Albugo laibachii Nc14]
MGTQGLKSSIAKGQSASISLLGAMYRQFGPAIPDTPGGHLKASTRDFSIKEIRERWKTSEDSGIAWHSSNPKSAESSLMDVFGRQDIRNLIKNDLLSDLR